MDTPYWKQIIFGTFCHSSMKVLCEGDRIYYFRLLKCIGGTGETTVYESVQLGANGGCVALKMKDINKDHNNQIHYEAEALSELKNCEGISKLVCCGTDSFKLYSVIVTKPVGKALDQIVLQNGPLLSEELLELARNVTHALQQIHSNGFLHRYIYLSLEFDKSIEMLSLGT